MGRARFACVTIAPMILLVLFTFLAAYQRIFDPDPRIGFLSLASSTDAKLAAGQIAADQVAAAQTVILNNRLDAAIGVVLLVVVSLIVLESIRQWYLLLTHRVEPRLADAP